MKIDVYPTTTIGFRPTLTAVGTWLAKQRIVPDSQQFMETVLTREQAGSTSIGGGLMVPHYMQPGLAPARLVAVPIHAAESWPGLDGQSIRLLLITCFDPDQPQPAFQTLLRGLASPAAAANLVRQPDAGLAHALENLMNMEENNGTN